jgi:osmotically-inducible protein OsmY
MKKTYVVIRFLVAVLMIAAFVAGTSTPAKSSAGDVVDDSVITTKIKTQLASDEFLKSFQISVETRKGVVELSGFVDSQKAKDKAGHIARGVDGVKSVANALIVK